eukprot:gi/632986979/ref/XP_007910541.1/ PREDICTED: uncharacterized protein LOC103191354 [Callorhinchus milii]
MAERDAKDHTGNQQLCGHKHWRQLSDYRILCINLDLDGITGGLVLGVLMLLIQNSQVYSLDNPFDGNPPNTFLLAAFVLAKEACAVIGSECCTYIPDNSENISCLTDHIRQEMDKLKQTPLHLFGHGPLLGWVLLEVDCYMG